ncbi:hypothetical protein DOY81_005378 [Sarcophaga bullata]|nr:hypothetical protein DOY81_005378 [Sarcophaga bullata]
MLIFKLKMFNTATVAVKTTQLRNKPSDKLNESLYIPSSSNPAAATQQQL